MDFTVSSMRWLFKKKARKILINCSKEVRRIKNQLPIPKIYVLTYHRFTDTKYDPFAVIPKDFEDQIIWLKQNTQILNVRTFDECLKGHADLDKQAVLITIDDGHRSFYKHAYPILKKYAIPAILFICPGLIDAKLDQKEFMSWDELNEVQDYSITVASHGLTHRSLNRMSLKEAQREVIVAKQKLYSYLQAENPYFSFPFGTRMDFSSSLADMLLNHGYRYCFTSIHGECEPLNKPNLFPRLKIEAGEDLEMFIAIIQGHLDAWKFVDNFLWPIQQRNQLDKVNIKEKFVQHLKHWKK